MNENDIQEFKHLLVQCLTDDYKMDNDSALKAVSECYVFSALKEDPDYVMHDTVEEWAEFIYNEYIESEPMEM